MCVSLRKCLHNSNDMFLKLLKTVGVFDEMRENNFGLCIPLSCQKCTNSFDKVRMLKRQNCEINSFRSVVSDLFHFPRESVFLHEYRKKEKILLVFTISTKFYFTIVFTMKKKNMWQWTCNNYTYYKKNCFREKQYVLRLNPPILYNRDKIPSLTFTLHRRV